MSGGDPTNVAGRTFQGELRESMWSGPVTLQDGQTQIVATLRSPWVYVGFMVDPGDAAAGGLSATLNILEPMMQGRVASVPIVQGVPPQAFVGFTVGARCELRLTNATGAPVTCKAAIWGMSRGGPGATIEGD